jgi:nickel-type superoxide dismutase maturation protease
VEGHQRPGHDPLAGLIRFASALAGAAALLILVPELDRRARRLRRSWHARVAIEGGSMAPTLLPGDWLLVDPDGYGRRAPVAGELVLAPDPREPNRLLIKRVADVDPDGWLRLAGDAPDTSTDSRTFGAIDPSRVAGRPTLRYWPPGRLGVVR